ncbi:MAG: hypothetical protein HZC26_03675 [Candidatus Magasanikbacteria bacterium]|nr:hypothetical protein [Candidatus Magasanikbacteria bacterium]
MLISFNWLRQYIDLPNSLTPEELALKLTMSTVEVEKVERQGKDLDNIVVGLVKKVTKHPDADKLKVCEVDVGPSAIRQAQGSGHFVQVVCGGSNVREGMLVAFGKVGAQVRWHGDGDLVELKPAKIRGVESFGMICASTEIGLGNRFPLKDEKEILDLTHLTPACHATQGVAGRPAHSPSKGEGNVGTPLAEVLGLDDVIFEIDNKSLSNRPDLWGHYGIAREVAALFKKELVVYPIKKTKKQDTNKLQITNYKLQIDIEDKKLCPRYMAAAIEGIKVAPSPDWLQKKLLAVGLRPINNIVDITNFIMLDLGQPMHAFGAYRIENPKSKIRNSKLTITVRRAEEGERFVESLGIYGGFPLIILFLEMGVMKLFLWFARHF